MKCGVFSFFKAVFGAVFLVIIAVLLFSENIEFACKNEFLLSNGVLICAVIILLLASALFYYWLKNNNRKVLKTYGTFNVDKPVLATTLILFLGQCYVCYNIFLLSGWDTFAIREFVDILANDLDREWINAYYSQYPNNLFISYLFLFLRKINDSFGIFSNEYSYMCVVVLNCAVNSLACWLSYKTAKIFLSSYFSLAAYILCIFSVGISGWSVVGYSDSLALFIPILSVYLYCRQYESARMKTVGYLLSGVVSVVGYFIKPQCLFVLIAVVILEVVKLIGKRSPKELLRPAALCLCAVILFTGIDVGLNLLNRKYGIRIDNEQTFGYTHFLMMGANEDSNGVWSAGDVAFSASFSTSEERSKANMEVFKQRITEMKADVLTHLRRKMLTTFNDGAFAWGFEGDFLHFVPQNINGKMAPFLKSIYHLGDRFIYFATFQQFVWLFILFSSLLTVFCKKTNTSHHTVSLLWITLLGFVLYEMLFEVRARYVYIFVPLFCVLAAIGIKNATVLMPQIRSLYQKTFRKDNKT